ncbi:hypothetical protein AB0I10_38815 [Streptomyces sp. NPDC050636]|uniref:hypothetical protein n=1 Tax=Streptomyces sp. NPDC050636 TaxID=3154510 RepID=UPI003428FC2F
MSNATMPWPETDAAPLKCMAVGERAKERAQRGQGPHLVEGHGHRTVPQPLDIVDAVRLGAHRCHQRHHLCHRVRPAAVIRTLDPYRRCGRFRKPSPLGKTHHRDQPGIRHQIRLVEHDRNC